jgi:hypothetical protein
MPNGEDRKPDGEFDNKTFLYIRTNPADSATGPRTPGLPFWLSPDITIIRPGGVRGSEGEVGENDQVEVVIHNAGGIDAVDACVDAFLADPSTAFTPATAQPVGSGFLTIPNHNLTAITFPWTPTVSDAGHRCMLARVTLPVPFDGYVNPAIFDAAGDRHVAQRNLSVLSLEGDSLSFGFHIVNPIGKKARFLLRVTQVRPGSRLTMLRKAIGSRFAQFSTQSLGGVGLTIGEVVPPVQEPCIPPIYALGLLKEPLKLPRTKTARIDLGLEDRRHAVVTITRNRDTRPGDINLVAVEQVDSRSKHVVGGLWLVIQS